MADPKPPLIWSSNARGTFQKFGPIIGLSLARTADRIVREIVEACRLLEDHPFGGRARNELRPGLRSIAVSPHIVFYRVREEVAEIVRVLDGRRDLDDIFS